MTKKGTQAVRPVVVPRSDLQKLFDALSERGYRLIGPTVRDRAVRLAEISSVNELPEGWTDEQDNGTYRVKPTGDKALFRYVVGQDSWKQYLYLPATRLWEARRDKDGGFQTSTETAKARKTAFIGARPCELQAIAVQDKVFGEGDFVDPGYKARRDAIFIVAVNCGQPSSACFCVSMKTGPKATSGFDLALTEILDAGSHYFVFEAGTKHGEEVLGAIAGKRVSPQEEAAAEMVTATAIKNTRRKLDTEGIKELLYRNFEHPRWDDVARRCLTCANCTMVCPTCFCSTMEDATDLAGSRAERWRRWDSCFSLDFSYIHGGSVRATGLSRYRQWMTHKLATWLDQFGVSGCVGCGRCIVWCPVGIDLTEETRAIRESEHPGVKDSHKSARKESGP